MSTLLPAASLPVDAGPGTLAPPRSWAGLAHAFKARVGGKLSYAFADQVVYSFGNMVVAALISRRCAATDFGMYILTQRSMDVLIQLSNVLLWGPFTYNLPGTPEEKKGLYQGSIFGLQLLFCLLFTMLLWVASRFVRGPGLGIYYGTFAPLVFASGGILFREFTRRMYFSHMRLREAFWTDVVTVLLQIAGVEWLYRTGRLSVWNTLLILCAGALLVSAWWLAREWPTFTCRWRAMRQDLQLNLRLGRWLLGRDMVFLAGSQCNPWILSALLGGSSVGAYTICESVVNIPRVALNSMQNVMGPMFARAHNEGGRRAVQTGVRRMNRLLLAGTVVCAFAIVWIGPWVARLIFRSSPPNARLVMLLLSINLIAYGATLGQAYGLAALNRADTTFYANVLGLLLQALVCYFLVRRFHLPGAAAAMLLGNLVVVCFRNWFFKREMAAV